MALESVARAIRDDEIAQKIISTLLPHTLQYLINVSYWQSVVILKIKKQRPYGIEKIRNNPHLKIRNKAEKSFIPIGWTMDDKLYSFMTAWRMNCQKNRQNDF